MPPNFSVELDAIGIVTLAIASITFLYKLGRAFVMWVIDLNKRLYKIDEINEQLRTNGGSTLRDAVNRIESRIVAVEQRQNVFVNDTRSGIFETDEQGEIVSVNRTYCRMFGISEKEAMGHGWINMIYEEERPRVIVAWNYAVENGIEFKMSYKSIDRNGQLITVMKHATPMKKNNGELIGFLGTIEETINEK